MWQCCDVLNSRYLNTSSAAEYVDRRSNTQAHILYPLKKDTTKKYIKWLLQSSEPLTVVEWIASLFACMNVLYILLNYAIIMFLSSTILSSAIPLNKENSAKMTARQLQCSICSIDIAALIRFRASLHNKHNIISTPTLVFTCCQYFNVYKVHKRMFRVSRTSQRQQ